MADSVEILVRIKQEGGAAIASLSADMKGLQGASEAASTSVDKVGVSGAKTSGAISGLSAEIRALAASVQGNTAAVSGLTAGLDALGTTTTRTSAGLNGLGGSARNATAELRALEGGLPIRAAGQFLSQIQSLQPILAAAFPVIGAIALVGVLDQMVEKVGNLYNAWNPVANAEKIALGVLKESTKEYEKLVQLSQKYSDDAYERKNGKVALNRRLAERAAGNAQYGDNENFGNPGVIPTLSSDIDKIDAALSFLGDVAQGKARLGTAQNPNVPRITRPGVNAKDGETTLGGETNAVEYNRSVLLEYRRAFQSELDLANQRKLVGGQAAEDFSSKADEEQKQKNDEAARKIQERASEITSLVDSLDSKGLTPLAKLIADTTSKLQAIITKNGTKLSSQEISDTTGAFQRGFINLRGGVSPIGSDVNEFNGIPGSNLPGIALGAQGKALSDNQFQLDPKNNANFVGDQIIKRAAANAAQYEKFQQDLNALSVHGLTDEYNQIDTNAKLRIDAANREYAITQDRAKFEKETNAASEDATLKRGELQKQQLDQARSLAGELFQSITSGNEKGFALGQLNKFGGQVFENATAPIIQNILKTAGSAFPSTGPIGGLLKGTILDQGGPGAATERNTTSLQSLTHSVDTLTSVISTGGGGVAGGGGIGSLPFGDNIFNSPLLNAIPGASGAGGALASLFGKASGLTSKAGGFLQNSGFQIAPGVGATYGQVLGAAGPGTAAAITGFAGGGVKGDLLGAGGAVSAASGLLSLIPSIAKSIPVVGDVIGAVLPLIGGLFGSSKSDRQASLNHDTFNRQFIEPVVKDYNTDFSGGQADYSYNGVARPIQNTTNNNYINAMDAGSFADYVKVNSGALADGITRAINNGSGDEMMATMKQVS